MNIRGLCVGVGSIYVKLNSFSILTMITKTFPIWKIDQKWIQFRNISLLMMILMGFLLNNKISILNFYHFS